MASRWSLRNVLSASRACQISTFAMVIDALVRALVALWSGPKVHVAPARNYAKKGPAETGPVEPRQQEEAKVNKYYHVLCISQ